jgi:O-methyltransferase
MEGCIMKKILKHLIYLLKKKYRVVITRDMMYLGRERLADIYNYLDYVIISTLELLAYEIKSNNVLGSTAEVGVYRGDFAKYINLLFPDRRLYLFDTFEGFPEVHSKIDRERGFSTGDQDWSGTSVELVIQQMPYPNNVVIKKGIFPETAKDVNDRFCFVSLDVDLYEPIKEGLRFFYPLLSPGGVIMVHDFNNSGYKGVREAVLEFCRERGISYVPIPDVCGTVIITKNLEG